MAILGIDIGTQSLKVIVCDDDLAVLASASRAYEHQLPRPGWAEQDPALWVAALAVTIPEALAAAGVDASAVTGIGLAGQLDGCVPVDVDGRAVGAALIWMDRRAVGEMPSIDADSFQAMTGQVADPSHMAAKIRWLKRHRAGAARYHQPVSFVLEALTGENVIDRGHASTTMLYDQTRRDYAPSLLSLFGVETGELPRIAEATDIAGALRGETHGLPAGVPVCVGTGDDFATPLGAGIIDPGALVCVLGTAEVVGVITRERVIDHSRLLETHDTIGGRYFLENPGWLAGGSIRWGQRLLGIAHSADFDALAARSTVGAGGVTFLPALAGAMAPRWEPNARGCLYGLSTSTTRADIARAILEGCAFAMNDVARRVIALDLALDEIALLGGGSRSGLWRQIRADIAGRQVRAATSVDTCAIGAATLAAIATGSIASIEDAANRLRSFGEPTLPRAEGLAASADAYDRYRRLWDGLVEMF